MAQPTKILPQQEIASVQLNLPQQGQEPQIPQRSFAITTSHKASQKKQMRGF